MPPLRRPPLLLSVAPGAAGELPGEAPALRLPDRPRATAGDVAAGDVAAGAADDEERCSRCLVPPLLSHLAGAHTQILARLAFSHCYLKPEQACDPGERSHKAVRVRATHCHRGDWARSREQVRCMFPETFLCPRFACPCGPVDSTVPSLVLCPVA